MKILVDEIQKSIAELGVETLQEKADVYIEKVVQKFSTNQIYKYPLWSYLPNRRSVHDPNGWKTISEFLPTEEKLFFFEPSNGNIAFHFKNSIDLVNVIENCFPFDFYVTNKAVDF
ncbi:MAG TPA: hypothetical protein VF476_18720, partial [Chitinophagaceae bacterium]